MGLAPDKYTYSSGTDFTENLIVYGQLTGNLTGDVTGNVNADIVTATTDIQVNGKSVATTGKAIAMAMVFG